MIRSKPKSSGFSLVETMVAVAIAGITLSAGVSLIEIAMKNNRMAVKHVQSQKRLTDAIDRLRHDVHRAQTVEQVSKQCLKLQMANNAVVYFTASSEQIVRSESAPITTIQTRSADVAERGTIQFTVTDRIVRVDVNKLGVDGQHQHRGDTTIAIGMLASDGTRMSGGAK